MSLQFSSSLDETKMVAMSSSLDGCYEKKNTMPPGSVFMRFDITDKPRHTSELKQNGENVPKKKMKLN
jgi:hypothetical protein